MNLSFEQLEAFVAAAEQGSFSAAGRALRKAQSAVSTQVANLEEDLGVALFSRAGRNPVLTAAGEILAVHARRTLLDAERALGEARREHDVLSHSQMRKEIVALEDHSHFEAQGTQIQIGVVDRQAADEDLARAEIRRDRLDRRPGRPATMARPGLRALAGHDMGEPDRPVAGRDRPGAGR